jgi:hypothetical protein
MYRAKAGKHIIKGREWREVQRGFTNAEREGGFAQPASCLSLACTTLRAIRARTVVRPSAQTKDGSALLRITNKAN